MSFDYELEKRYNSCSEIFLKQKNFGEYINMRSEKRRQQRNWITGIIIVILISFLGWGASLITGIQDNKSEIKSVKNTLSKQNYEIKQSLNKIEKAVVKE